MIHQPLGGAQGQETDLEIQVNLQFETLMLFPDQYSILTKDIIVLISQQRSIFSDLHTQLYIACYLLSLYITYCYKPMNPSFGQRVRITIVIYTSSH